MVRWPDEAAIVVNARDLGALAWLFSALIVSGLVLFALGYGVARTSRIQRDRYEVVNTMAGQISDGLALFNRRGRMLWINEAGRALLYADGQLRVEISDLIGRKAKRGSLQTITIDEGKQYRVQILLTVSSVMLIVRPLTVDSAQNQFYERFLQRIVHDMRNPLAAILAHTDNMQSSADSDHHALAVIEGEALRLTKLVDSLLFDARLSYVPLALESLDLIDTLEEVVYAFEDRAGRERKTLALEMPEPRPILTADRDLLIRAISNLIDNSLQYTEPGGTITTSVRARSDGWLIQVADDGVGIPADFLPNRIFEPTVRARQKSSISGSGLGLSIVKKIAELHGGSVAVQSEIGRGTTIGLWFPK